MNPPDLPQELERGWRILHLLICRRIKTYKTSGFIGFVLRPLGEEFGVSESEFGLGIKKSKIMPTSVHLSVLLPGFVGLCITSCSGPSILHPVQPEGGGGGGGGEGGAGRNLRIFGLSFFALPSDTLNGFR